MKDDAEFMIIAASELPKRSTWYRSYGRWKYNRENLTLVHTKSGYEIDLEQCRNSESVLDWICQIAHKTWATPEDLGQLVLAFDHLLDPQRNICGGGISNGRHGEFDVKAFRTEQEGKAR